MTPPSTSLADSVWFWCVCVGVWAAAATFAATRRWFRRHIAALIAGHNQTLKTKQETLQTASDCWQAAERHAFELQAKLRAFESARVVGQTELEALIVRRWLRNAGEHANPSPQKAVAGAAAVALAFVGAEHLRARVEPLTAVARQLETKVAEGADVGAQLMHPETQASQQWLQVLAELDALLSPDAKAGLLDEWLWGRLQGGGEYWNQRALRMAAGEVLTQGHMAAMEIARKRALNSAQLGPATEPPDGSPAPNAPPA